MKIGVELRVSGDPGELFADARALEAAGADSFWSAPDADQLTLLAAVAAVTWRARLVTTETEVSSRARTTLEQLSRGRLVIAAATGRETLVPLAEGDAERWVREAFPEGRAAWRELRAAREAEGIAGIVLANDPRLLDLIRNPDTEDDRPDLRLAFG